MLKATQCLSNASHFVVPITLKSLSELSILLLLLFFRTNVCCALLIASSDGTILRLPCKVFADFNVIHLGKRLIDHVLVFFNGLQDTQCMVKCVKNVKCRSYNTNRKDGRCEINGKALVDNGTILKADPDWVYKSTNYSLNLVCKCLIFYLVKSSR